MVAAREVFLTWGLCGAIVMQITSHNRYHHSLRRDIAGVIIITLLVLLLSAFVASACVQIIGARGLDYLDNSSFGACSFQGFDFFYGNNTQLSDNPKQSHFYFTHKSFCPAIQFLFRLLSRFLKLFLMRKIDE